MKMEKINDRQIRCVLTKEDLEMRKIRLSELVSGSEKARVLFRDMMIRASRELGFSFNNNPLMIEAVPTGKDQLVLIITRVDDPNELDSRFRNLSGKIDTENADSDKNASVSQMVSSLSGADDILNLLKKFKKRIEEMGAAASAEKGEDSSADTAQAEESSALSGNETVPGKEKSDRGRSGSGKSGNGKPKREKSGKELEEEIYQYTRFYLFRNLENVLSASRRVPEDYKGENSLYKNPDDGAYYLLVKKMDTDPEQFNRICNVLSEYSMPMDYSTGMDEFFREHMQVIVAKDAMQHLRGV